MKFSVRFSLSIALALLSQFASAIPKTPELVAFRDQVFRKRLLVHLNLRRQGIQACLSEKPELAARAQSFINGVQTENREWRRSQTTSPAKVIALLQLLKNSGPLNKAETCHAQIKTQEDSLKQKEREQFALPAQALKDFCYVGSDLSGFDSLEHCRETMKTLLQELDPSCVLNAGAFYRTQNVENNPCFAGTRVLIAALTPNHGEQNPLEVYPAELVQFLLAYDRAIVATPNGGSFDLWPLFDRGRGMDSPEAHRFFLGILVFLASAGSSERGYMSQVYEAIWLRSLRDRVPPAMVYATHSTLNDINDFYFNLFANAQVRKQTVTVRGLDITRHNRHNFIAALLACHFEMTDRPEFADHIPAALGFAYESLDFISHLKHRISWERSVQNFTEDTERYLASSMWGKTFCQPGLSAENRQ